MKMSKQQVETLRALLETSKVQSLSVYKEMGLSEMRWRWDMVWMSDKEKRQAFFDEVYLTMNDDHVDTALRYLTGTK